MKVLVCFSLFHYVLFHVLSHMRLSCANKYFLLTLKSIHLHRTTQHAMSWTSAKKADRPGSERDLIKIRSVYIVLRKKLKQHKSWHCLLTGKTSHRTKLGARQSISRCTNQGFSHVKASPNFTKRTLFDKHWSAVLRDYPLHKWFSFRSVPFAFTLYLTVDSDGVFRRPCVSSALWKEPRTHQEMR